MSRDYFLSIEPHGVRLRVPQAAKRTSGGPGAPRGAAREAPERTVPLRARVKAMWAGGMSETAIRRALALSEHEAVACGLIWSRTAGMTGRRPGADAGQGAYGSRPGPPRDKVSARDGGSAALGPAMAEVLEAVARASGLDREILRGPGQARAPVRARQLVMYLLREACPRLSLSAIGHFLGRDHSTVLHGCRRAAARLDRDPAFRRLYEAARRELDARPRKTDRPACRPSFARRSGLREGGSCTGAPPKAMARRRAGTAPRPRG